MITIDNSDHFLQAIIRSVNGQEKTVPITILVDGFLITGDLVSGHKYFKHTLEYFPPSTKPVTEQDQSEYVLDVLIDVEQENYLQRKGNVSMTTSYIHLINAKFQNSSGVSITGIKGVTWRGMIDKVSGFYLG